MVGGVGEVISKGVAFAAAEAPQGVSLAIGAGVGCMVVEEIVAEAAFGAHSTES